jgi:hypothetical protein
MMTASDQYGAITEIESAAVGGGIVACRIRPENCARQIAASIAIGGN